jgi:carboxyl-terminal processing protease
VILRILTSRHGREEWVETGELALFEAVGLLKGPPGTTVSIEIVSKGDEAPRRLTIERARIEVPSVLFALILPRPGGIGYVDLSSFQEKTGPEFKAAVDGLLAQGMKGLIIDLRYNPGGTLGSSVEVADLFLDEGETIVSVRGRNASFTEAYSAKKAGTYPAFPVVVLIEGTSASAAEIVAAALHDNHRATLIGERTFGKGSVQSIIPVSLGEAYGEGGLRLTCARYYTPKGVCIHREPDSKEWGVAPDVEVKLTDEEKRKLWDERSRAWIDRNSPGSPSATAYPDDPQVEAACGRLIEQLGPAERSPAAVAGTPAP